MLDSVQKSVFSYCLCFFQKKEFITEPCVKRELIQKIFDSKDIGACITPHLSIKSLLAMRLVAKQQSAITETELINRINRGEIHLKHLGINTISELIDFFGESCSQIQRIDLREISYIIDADIKRISESFTSIQHLFLNHASITDSSAVYFEQMVRLITLDLSQCVEISNYSFLSALTSLKELSLWGCFQINTLNFLEHCKGITHLYLPLCTNIKDFSLLKHTPLLENLNLRGCTQIGNVNFLEHCPAIKVLDLTFCRSTDFSPLQKCTSLKTLILSECNSQTINFLDKYPSLESLDLSGNRCIDDFSAVKYCPSLSSLDLSRCEITQFDFLNLVPQLRHLDLEGCTLGDFSFLINFPLIESLGLGSCKEISDFSFLASLKALKSLDLSKCLKPLDLLKNCPLLESLNLFCCDHITDLSALAHCPLLNHLNLSWCLGIKDLGFLQFTRSLKTIDLFNCPELNSKKNLITLIDKGIILKKS